MAERFSPTETAILEKLSDGCRHHKTELMSCIQDDLANPHTLSVQVCRINKKLAKSGHEIITQYYGRRYYYRWMRIHSEE